jgi:type III pantothenate kinase
MNASQPFPIIAVDIGNNRIKLGRFESSCGERLPLPTHTLHVAGSAESLDLIGAWLADGPPCCSWWIGSVNRPATTRLVNWLRLHGQSRIMLLAAGDLALRVELPRPDMVGIDRLLDAVAANALRDPRRGAVIVDVGTAITVDLLSADGVFRGGAIAPGIAMSARALHEFTDLLPQIDMLELGTPPSPLGASTPDAMRSGLFWGAVGAIRELTRQISMPLPNPPEVFLTGGAGPAVASLLGPEARHVPHLTLAGIAVTASAQAEGGTG